jgi:uncharacterized repeat protein (TIGR01451 family)/fimbrial isopeptide formation D2 family protein
MVSDRPRALASTAFPGMRIVAAVAASLVLVLAGVSAPANAAVTAVHELTANWTGGTVPTSAPYGQALTSEWHLNTNDVGDPYAKDPVSNVRATLVATNGVFSSIPAVCKTTGVTPVSSISANGSTLVCNLGTITEGTASVIQAVVRATGPVGSNISVSGTATSDSAAAPTAPTVTPLLPITGTHGMDLVISAASDQQITTASRFGGNRQTIAVDYGVAMTAGSIPGPSTYTFTLDIAVSPAGQLPGLQWEGCAPVDNSGTALGIPYSASTVADRTNAPTCMISGSGTHYTITLSGLDYSMQHVPTKDSLGNAIPAATNFVASGKLSFSYTSPITTNTGVTFTGTPTSFTFVDGVTQSETNAGNDGSGTTLIVPGIFSDSWQGGPTVGRAPWDANLFVAPGSAQNKTFPWPAAGTSTNPGRYSINDQPLLSQADSVAWSWSGYTGAGGADLAGACTMFQNPAAFTARYVDILAADSGANYSQMTTGHVWYRTDAVNTKTETCGEPVGVAGSPWTAAPFPAGCASQSVLISPAYSDDQCLITLPAGVTAVKMTWNPAVDKQVHHFLRVWGYVPSTAPIGAESWTVGAFNMPSDPALVFGPTYPKLNNYINVSTSPIVTATIPGSVYGPNTNGYRDAMRIIGPNGVITKTTPSTTAKPGVPVTYNLTAEADLAVTTPPNQTFTVVDTLPTGMTYVAGSGTPTPAITVNGSGQQVLTFTFTNVPANTAQPITYQAQTAANSAIAPGTVLTNTAQINVPGDTRAAAARQAAASVTVPSSGATTLGKSVEANVLSFYGDSSAWDLAINSQDPVSNSFTDTIDVLPKNGDGRGTNIDGTYSITGVTAPAGSTIYYSTAPFASISNDPRSASNGGTPGSVSGNTVGWSTTSTAKPTAIRVIGPALAPGATQQIRIAFTTPAGTSCTAPAAGDNKPGQLLVNSADSFAGHTRLPMLSSATTTIGDCYAVDLKKYVLAKGGDPNNDADWHDANTVADYQQYAAGDVAPYRIVVTNKGTGTLRNIPVADSLMPSCNTTIPSLAAGASSTISCSMTVGVGTTVNTASLTVAPPSGPVLTASDPAGVVVPTPYTIAKTSNPASGSAVNPGSVVQYTVTVTESASSAAPFPAPSLTDSLAGILDDANYNGDVTASTGAVTVSGSTLSWSAAQIMPGQTIIITYSVTVKAPDTGDHSLLNTVTPPSGISCASACSTNNPVPGIQFTKTANVAVAHPGDVVTYTVSAKNTGQVVYTAGAPASLTDDLTAVLDDATYDAGSATGGATVAGSTLSWSGALAIGATTSFTYTVTIKDPNTGNNTLTNTIVSSTAGSNCASGSTDPLCTAIVKVQSYTVAKTSSAQTTAPGGVISYTVTVTNTGSVPYTAAAPASFTDDLSQVLNGASYNGDASGGASITGATLSWSGALPVGASATVTYSVTVDAPATNKTLTNQVAPTGAGGSCVSAGDCKTITLVGTYTVQKSVSTATTTPGSTVTYTILVTNTSAVAFTAANPASFTDSLVGDLDDASYPGGATATAGTVSYGAPTLSWSGPLAVGGTQTISYTIVVDNPDSGDHTLTNVVFTPPNVGNCDTGSTDPACSTTTLVQSYRAVKTADADVAIPGSTITYTVTVTNTGEVAYTAGGPATVSDDLSNVLNAADYVSGSVAADTGTATLSGSTISWSGPLAVGETTSFHYQVVVQPGPNPRLDNTITTGSGGNCSTGSNDPVCEVVVPTKSYDVVKSASQTTAVPGDTITYTITLTNTGSIAYTTAAGEQASFSDDLSNVLDDADYVAGSLTNSAVLGADNVIRWSGALPVGGQETFSYQVTVRAPDAGDHSLKNRVLTPPGIGGSCTSDSTDPGCVSVVPVKSYTVSKTVSAMQAQPGDRVSYTIVVTNTGQVDYTGTAPASLSDDLSAVLDDASYNGDVAATSGTAVVAGTGLAWSGALVVGGTATITYSVTVTGGAGGNQKLDNAVTPTASGGSCAAPGTCSTEVPVRMLKVVKSASPATTVEGGVVTYTVTLTNTGAVDFTATAPASFSDDLSAVLDDATYQAGSATGGGVFSSPILSWSGIQLAAGNSTSFSYKIVVNSPDTGDHLLDNVVSTPPGLGSNCDAGSNDPDCHTETQVRSLHVAKSVSIAVASPGDTVTYTIVVTNTGALPYDAATPASFTDDLSPVIDDATYQNDAAATSGTDSYAAPFLGWSGSLPVGGSATITYSVKVIVPVGGDGILNNLVVTPPGVGGNCESGSTDPDCTTVTDVRAYSVSKAASATTVLPGGVVSYTITVRNTGQADYTTASPASLSDDLSAITDDASYNGDATDGATVTGNTLSWSGPLAVGATVVITYSFTVGTPLTGDGTLTNAVAPTDPTGSCVTAAQCKTTTLVKALQVTKAASQTTAVEGDTITYTIEVQNIGQVDYADASFTDNLARVADDGTFVVGSLTNGAVLSSGVVSWHGPLAVGVTEVITYQMKVTSPDRGNHSLNNTVVTPPGTGANCDPGSTDPECTTIVPIQSFHVAKKADVIDFVPGDVVSYTITVTNTGQVDYPAGAPAAFTDDLAQVLDDANYQADATATGGTVGVTAGVLSWSGPLAIGETVTITYSVQIKNPDPGDKVLTNVVVTPAGSGANCPAGSTDPQCGVTILGPSLEVQKSASTSTLLAGGVLSYSVQITNNGTVDFTSVAPATISDDLSGVLDDATYNGDANHGATVSGSTLTWSGPLAVGASITITYSVTAKTTGAGDRLLDNAVSTPPGVPSNCSGSSTDPDCATRTPVKAFTTVKSTTASGTLQPGDTIRYQVLVTNTGQVDYTSAEPASFIDDFNQVLDDAKYNNDATTTLGSVTYATPVLSWSGPLAVGETGTITYSFTIDSTGGDGRLLNAVVSSGSGGNCFAATLGLDCQLDTLAVHDPLASTGVDISIASGVAILLFGLGGFSVVIGRRRWGVRRGEHRA